MEKSQNLKPADYTAKLGHRNSSAGCLSTKTSDQTCIQVYRAFKGTNKGKCCLFQHNIS